MADPLKINITGNLILDRIPEQAQRMMFKEAQFLSDEMKLIAPIKQGSLQKSIRPVIEDKSGKSYIVNVITDVESKGFNYGIFQNDQVLNHVPSAQIGKIGFQDYSKRISSKKKEPARTIEQHYARGYYYALSGRFPYGTYKANFAGSAINSRGGMSSIIKRIKESI